MTTRIPAVGALLLVWAIGLAGCVKQPPAAVKPPPPEVTVSKPVSCEVTDYFEFPGQTAAVGDVDIHARVCGYLVKVNFKDGEEVKKGDLLYQIDPRPYQAALDRAEGDLARLHALLEKAKVNLARSEKLRPSGATSEDEYEQAVAQLAVQKASIQSAEAAVRDAQLNLEFTQIVSPIDGRVSRTRITEGNLVGSGPDKSCLLTTVVTMDPIYVYFNVDEPALLRYEGARWGAKKEGRPDQIKDLQIPVEIGLPNEEGFPHTGILDFVDNAVDEETGTIRARGVFDNAARYLTPGLFVRVRIPFGKPHPALLVTERAIGRDQKQKFLLAVNKDNVVEYRRVELGVLRDGLRVITSGIQADDSIIVKGLQRVRPGATVRPQYEEQAIAGSGGSAAPASTPSPAATPAVATAPAAAQVGRSDQASPGRAAN